MAIVNILKFNPIIVIGEILFKLLIFFSVLVDELGE